MPRGYVNIALIGPVAARGLTAPALARRSPVRLRDGFVRDPHVSVEVEAYRPFYILGEVNALAKCLSARHVASRPRSRLRADILRAPTAQRHAHAHLQRRAAKSKVPLQTQLRPGDTGQCRGTMVLTRERIDRTRSKSFTY